MKLDSNGSSEAQIVEIRLEVGQIVEIVHKLFKLGQTITIRLDYIGEFRFKLLKLGSNC